MQLPLELTFRDDTKSDAIENLIREKADKLDRYHPRIMSCRVAVEQPHHRESPGYRVRLDITVPPGTEIVVERGGTAKGEDGDLHALVLDAFDAARRQLQKLAEQQRGDQKRHPEQEVRAFVSKLFDDYGFIEAIDGREIYFHRNSVVNAEFDQVEIGSGVAFEEERGEEGPQASSVRILVPHRPADAGEGTGS